MIGSWWLAALPVQQSGKACFAFIEPLNEIPLERATVFDCSRPHLRHPKETKGQDYDATTGASACCDDGSGNSCC